MPSKKKPKSGYVLNAEKRTLHRLPTRESCNMDQAVRKKYYANFKAVPKAAHRCGHCFAK